MPGVEKYQDLLNLHKLTLVASGEGGPTDFTWTSIPLQLVEKVFYTPVSPYLATTTPCTDLFDPLNNHKLYLTKSFSILIDTKNHPCIKAVHTMPIIIISVSFV